MQLRIQDWLVRMDYPPPGENGSYSVTTVYCEKRKVDLLVPICDKSNMVIDCDVSVVPRKRVTEGIMGLTDR